MKSQLICLMVSIVFSYNAFSMENEKDAQVNIQHPTEWEMKGPKTFIGSIDCNSPQQLTLSHGPTKCGHKIIYSINGRPLINEDEIQRLKGQSHVNKELAFRCNLYKENKSMFRCDPPLRERKFMDIIVISNEWEYYATKYPCYNVPLVISYDPYFNQRKQGKNKEEQWFLHHMKNITSLPTSCGYFKLDL